MKYFIGIDIGGTNISTGVVDETYNIVGRGKIKSLEEAKIDAKMILQVHDELILESHRDCAEEASAILRREMEHAIELSVPLTVELTVGDSWYN